MLLVMVKVILIYPKALYNRDDLEARAGAQNEVYGNQCRVLGAGRLPLHQRV